MMFLFMLWMYFGEGSLSQARIQEDAGENFLQTGGVIGSFNGSALFMRTTWKSHGDPSNTQELLGCSIKKYFTLYFCFTSFVQGIPSISTRDSVPTDTDYIVDSDHTKHLHIIFTIRTVGRRRARCRVLCFLQLFNKRYFTRRNTAVPRLSASVGLRCIFPAASPESTTQRFAGWGGPRTDRAFCYRLTNEANAIIQDATKTATCFPI